MRIVAIVQARYSSQRLPGKILQPLDGRPLLAHVFEALAQSRQIDDVMLATSTDQSDDPVALFAERQAIPLFRGHLERVFSRFLAAAIASNADGAVRISGDSPLIDPALIDRGVRLFREDPSLDLVSNVSPRSFPKGQSVEVIATRAMLAAAESLKDPYEQEHVTPHFYALKNRYRVQNFVADMPRPGLQLSVDTSDDFKHCAAILRHLGMPAWQAGWQGCGEASDAVRRSENTR